MGVHVFLIGKANDDVFVVLNTFCVEGLGGMKNYRAEITVTKGCWVDLISECECWRSCGVGVGGWHGCDSCNGRWGE